MTNAEIRKKLLDSRNKLAIIQENLLKLEKKFELYEFEQEALNIGGVIEDLDDTISYTKLINTKGA